MEVSFLIPKPCCCPKLSVSRLEPQDSLSYGPGGKQRYEEEVEHSFRTDVRPLLVFYRSSSGEAIPIFPSFIPVALSITFCVPRLGFFLKVFPN
jgi:hypothetical protein